MKLYDRDYCNVTQDELETEKAIRAKYTFSRGNLVIYSTAMYRELPKAIRHFESLFPNNFLDIEELDNHKDLHNKNKGFLRLLNDTKTIETDIKMYIRNH